LPVGIRLLPLKAAVAVVVLVELALHTLLGQPAV
jgi:hypothetical protein